MSQSNQPVTKLYQLGLPENPPAGAVEWPWDDMMTDWCTGMIVTATSLEDARKTAGSNSMDEGKQVWLNPEHTECVEIGTAAAGIAPGRLMLRYII